MGSAGSPLHKTENYILNPHVVEQKVGCQCMHGRVGLEVVSCPDGLGTRLGWKFAGFGVSGVILINSKLEAMSSTHMWTYRV